MNNDQPQVNRLLKTVAEVPPLPRRPLFQKSLKRVVVLSLTLTLASGLVASATSTQAPGEVALATGSRAPHDRDAILRTAFWPFDPPRTPAIYDSLPHDVTPHPAVARIIVPETGATAYGSGTLVDVRDNYGLVVTNWHVVRDSEGTVEVVFGNGFRSHARPLKVDSNWDLAALVIWRPTMEPVKVAVQPPQPGDLLTIHGYGKGKYRVATGRCTGYYAPHNNFPMEMLELDVEARQGDSGGPIFNQRGELAGVLFGAGQGTTLGSYAPRVSNFLASLAPDIGQADSQSQVAVADRPAPNVNIPAGQQNVASGQGDVGAGRESVAGRERVVAGLPTEPQRRATMNGAQVSLTDDMSPYPSSPWSAHGSKQSAASNTPPSTFPPPPSSPSLYDHAKSAFALIGIAAIALKLVKSVG